MATKTASGSRPGGKSRSAITGKYVTRSTAQRHPRTTVTERTTKKG